MENFKISSVVAADDARLVTRRNASARWARWRDCWTRWAFSMMAAAWFATIINRCNSSFEKLVLPSVWLEACRYPRACPPAFRGIKAVSLKDAPRARWSNPSTSHWASSMALVVRIISCCTRAASNGLLSGTSAEYKSRKFAGKPRMGARPCNTRVASL